MVNSKIARAVRWAIAVGAVAGSGVALAQDRDAAQSKAEDLESVVVTGTRLRRVDVEAAGAVTVVDQATIEQSGSIVLGDILQRIPEVAGAGVNAQLGNGNHGSGAATISLRGLGDQRTLILLDGRRVGPGTFSNFNPGSVDINQLPVNLIERVEVLKEGAGAIYGSDAIAGVVNFITKKPTDGLEFTGDYGITSRGDGERHSMGVTFGAVGERSGILIGGNYNEQETILSGERDFSAFPLYLYSGQWVQGGASTTPTGRIFLPPALAAQYGCGSVTRAASASGASTADYGCYGSGGAYAGPYNYQSLNTLLTPQERESLFFKSEFQVADSHQAYANVIYNRTSSGMGLSPLGFNANNSQVVISKDSIYNPFGIDFGGGAAVGGRNPNLQMLFEPLGRQRSEVVATNINAAVGMRGEVGFSDWRYDVAASYGRVDQNADVSGYVLHSALQAALGPSFISSAGVPTCGTVSQPIPNCTPLNIFNLTAPGQLAALQGVEAVATQEGGHRNSGINVDLNGRVMALPAGDMLGSIGLGYTDESEEYSTGTISQLRAPLYTTCGIQTSRCSTNYNGSFDVKEAYIELFAPLLKDLPGVHSLNLDVGTRFSDYSLAGSTTRSQFKIEYRPVSSLLVRATYAQVFRAPQIGEAFGGRVGGLRTFRDPCKGFLGAGTADLPNLPAACVGVPADGSFLTPDTAVPAVSEGNVNLRPETGDVLTAGLVYDPTWAPNLSLSAGYWNYELTDVIAGLDVNFVVTQCARDGDPEFCNLAQRFATGPNAGRVITVRLPNSNLGTIKADGVDFGARYELRDTAIGSFRFTLDASHINSYTTQALPGGATRQIAGIYGSGGNLAKVRALAGIGWSYLNADALVTARYIGSIDVPGANRTRNPDGSFYFAGIHVDPVIYVDLTASYNFPTNTKVQVGVLNLMDKEPPILGSNFSQGGAQTDALTYDQIGRRFSVSFIQRF